MYYIQECYNGGTIHNEWSRETEREAITSAARAFADACFEADYVRVLSVDGELVWSSDDDGGSS